jgi:hypothetical protein
MENWSEKTIHANFKANFFLDTNILSYLVDKTFTGLNSSVKFFVESEFVTLSSSRFAIFEFVKIRKKEHFLRVILEKTKSKKSGKVNLSSLLRYTDSYSHNGITYSTEGSAIKRKVWAELRRINTEFQLDYENNDLHPLVWKPTFDLYLSSVISGEDTLITISSIFPSIHKKETDLHLITNDEQFVKAHSDIIYNRKIKNSYRINDLIMPTIIDIGKFTCNNLTVNLTNKRDDNRAKKIVLEKIKEIILSKNKDFYIGKTISVPAKAPQNVICFELPSNSVLHNNVHLVFIGKDLNFYYTTKSPITNFLDNMNPLVYPYQRITPSRLAFTLQESNDEGIPLVYQAGMLQELRKSGNFIFIHPDTLLNDTNS